MRQRFEQQLNLGTLPISEIKIPTKSRDEMPPTVRALQHIFLTPELNEKVFSLLEEAICADKKKTGRKGMDLWHILVLAVVRHATGTNWDRLHMMANYDGFVRQIMGVHATKFGAEEIEFEYQNILDNVSLIDEDLLYQINTVVVEAGHQLLKKKEKEALELRLKTDSYVLETNVYFPTDLRLLYDSVRKCLNTISQLRELLPIQGWRKLKHLRKSFKILYRSTSQQVFKGKSEVQKKQKVTAYVLQSTALISRFEEIIKQSVGWHKDAKVAALLAALTKYKDYAVKLTDQIDRRLLKGETIPAEEKIYSIFEPHTEWITKGKLNKKVELGHLILITTDQYQFIIDYKVMEQQKDAAQVKPLTERLRKNFADKKIYSHSFDKSFHSKDNYQTLQQANVEQIILPKKGKLNKEEKQRESHKSFKQLRNAHSAVESNINMLEHHGLSRCMDKGLKGYKRCVGLSVLAYNLHILGNALYEQDRKKEQRLAKRRRRYRQAA